MGLKSLLLAHGAGVLAVPWIAGIVGAPIVDQMGLFLLAEGSFFLGALLVLISILLAYITLDADVVRHKGERAAARSRLVESEFPEQFGDAPEAERVKSQEMQRKYWRIGVALSWATVCLVTISMAAFVAGGIFAALLVAATAG